MVLDDALRSQLASHIDKIVLPIELAVASDGSEAGGRLSEMAADIAALSDDIAVVERSDAPRRPSLRVQRAGTDVAVEFAGVPGGHEFTSLILALLQVGGHPPRLDDDVAAQVRALDGEHRFETFVSLTCQVCPDVVQALNAMAVLNPRISHTMVDGSAFPDEVAERNIQAVPTTYRNGELFEHGRIGVEEVLSRLDEGRADRVAAEIDAKDDFDVLVVGGGPAGAAAAVYAARKGVRTGLVADRFGGQLLDTMGIENFLSTPYTEGPKLATALEDHVRTYPVDVMAGQTVVGLEPGGPRGLHTVALASGAQLRARSVVVASGARWRRLDVPGEEEHLNKGVAFCPHCDGPLFTGKRVAVVGGGNSGVEAAIDLAGLASHVTVVEFADELMADSVLQASLRNLDNVEVALGAATSEIVGDGSQVTGIRYQDRHGGEQHEVALDGVFVQIGLLPNTEWLEGVVELTDRGEIVIDDRGQTSVPGIVAAGDCTTVPYKQIVIALGAGATAGLGAWEHLVRSSVAAADA